MNKSGINGDSSSPSTGEHGGPSKRQKLDNINTSTRDTSDDASTRESKWERIGLIRELEALRTALSNIEVTKIQLRKMRKGMEEIFDEEEKVLEMQARVKNESIEHLRVRLETDYGQEACEPQATADAEMATMECRIGGKIKALFTETARLNERSIPSNSKQTPTSSNSQEIRLESHELNEEDVEIKVERISEENMETLDSDLQYSELENVNVESDEYGSASAGRIIWEKEKKRANELGEQLESAQGIISTLREDLRGKLQFKGRISDTQKKLDDASGVEQQVVQRRSGRRAALSAASSLEAPSPQQSGEPGKRQGRKSRALVDGLQKKGRKSQQMGKGSTGRNGTDSEGSPWEVSGEDESSSDHQSEEDAQEASEGQPDYYALPSDPKFFTIDWEKHYIRCDRSRQYVCNECSYMTLKRRRMEDHIWIKHYGEHFRCPFCPPTRSLRSRDTVVQHVRNLHSNDS